MTDSIVEILIALTVALFISSLLFHAFMLLKERIQSHLLNRWVYFETGMYQNEETGDVIVVPEEDMKLVEHGQHKGQYVKVKEEGRVYFYDKITEKG